MESVDAFRGGGGGGGPSQHDVIPNHLFDILAAEGFREEYGCVKMDKDLAQVLCTSHVPKLCYKNVERQSQVH